MKIVRSMVFILSFLQLACREEGGRRSETTYDFLSMKPLLVNNLPDNFKNLSTDSSSKICSDDSCSTLGKVIQQHILGSEISGSSELLTRVDEKTTSYSSRIKEHLSLIHI